MGRRRRARRDHDPARGDQCDLRGDRQAAAQPADPRPEPERSGVAFGPHRAFEIRTERTRSARMLSITRPRCAYFARLQTTSLLVPAVVAGLVYLSSSAVSDVMVRFCVAPLRLG